MLLVRYPFRSVRAQPAAPRGDSGTRRFCLTAILSQHYSFYAVEADGKFVQSVRNLRHISVTVNCNDNQLASNVLKDEFYIEFRDEIYIEQKNKLMERLVRLCNKTEVVKTFSSQLMERIQKSMSHNNEILYDLLMEDIIWGDGDKISGFEVVNVDITNCNDQKIQNMISYNVEIEIKMFYSTSKEREMYKLMGNREFDIYYDFVTDKLLTKLYDSLTLGRCELSDFILLEN